MDSMIRQTIDGLLSGFAHLQISDPALQEEVDRFKTELEGLGERSGDVGAFMADLQTSGLMQTNSDLMTKAAMATQASGQDNTSESQDTDGSSSQLLTVREFLEQYRPAYDAAKNHGYQFRAVWAYETIFSIADRTDDLLEMNIILEEEGHLRAMTAEAMYDINKLAWDSQDPNNQGTRDQFQKLMELAENYETNPELDYRLDQLIQENQQGSFRFNFTIHPVANLGYALITYVICKTRVWSCQDLQEDTANFIIARENLIRTYHTIQEFFGWDFETIVKDPWLERWLILTVPVEPLGLGCRSMAPQNIELFREVLFEEALSALEDTELLQRPFHHPMHFAIDSSAFPEHREVEERLGPAVEAKLKDRYYYDYQRKVKAITPD